MNIPELIAVADVNAQLTRSKAKGPYVSVVVAGRRIKDLCRIGDRYWFEYHCWESPESADAELWYRSHEQCTVLALHEEESPSFTTLNERCDAGHVMCYCVRFDDGFKGTVFEDELLSDQDSFVRPDPPRRNRKAF